MEDRCYSYETVLREPRKGLLVVPSSGFTVPAKHMDGGTLGHTVLGPSSHTVAVTRESLAYDPHPLVDVLVKKHPVVFEAVCLEGGAVDDQFLVLSCFKNDVSIIFNYERPGIRKHREHNAPHCPSLEREHGVRVSGRCQEECRWDWLGFLRFL